MSVFKGFGTAEHVVNFLSLQLHLAFKLSLDPVDVRAGAAEEAHVVARLLRQQDVRTGRTEQHSGFVVVACRFFLNSVCLSCSVRRASRWTSLEWLHTEIFL